MKPWCVKSWVMPTAGADFVFHMEKVLEVYARPYDENHPVVCLDESPKQLIEQSRETYTDEKGVVHQDYEYIRHGVQDLYMITEPLGCKREVLVKPNHNSQTYAEVLAYIAEEMYPERSQITLIEDNLSAHRMAALYERFAPERALKIAQKFNVVRTPAHGSWLNIAECELSVLTRHGLKERIKDEQTLKEEVKAWSERRNRQQKGVDWQFTTNKARTKLKRLYPSIVT